MTFRYVKVYLIGIQCSIFMLILIADLIFVTINPNANQVTMYFLAYA